MAKNSLKLTVVIPAYNEVKNFHRGVMNQVVDYLRSQSYSWEVILVDDGSTDETRSLLTDFSKQHAHTRLLSIQHGGKAAAVQAGIMEAKGEYVLFTDFDQSTPISEVAKVLAEFSQGADVVIGNRVGDQSQRQNDPLIRYLRSRIFNLLVQVIALPGIQDTQCGFKAFKTPLAKQIFQNFKVHQTHQIQGGYMGSFDVEALFLARKMKLTIRQIPVSWQHHESERLTTSEPLKMLRDILKVRLYDLQGKYQLR